MAKRVSTGVGALDQALGGGVPTGASLLFSSPQGAGSTELALCLLRAAVAEKRSAHFVTALRSARRARDEAYALFNDAPETGDIRFVELREDRARDDALGSLRGASEGGILVVESAAALTRALRAEGLARLVRSLGEEATVRGVVVIHLHAHGTLSPNVEAALEEACDGVLTLAWRDGGPTRRRLLFVSKFRGLAPAVEGDQVPVYDASLERGAGFKISRVKNLL